MITSSRIPSGLKSAYLETEYVVFSFEPFTLKIGQKNTQLITMRQQHQAASSAFITAWSPYSHPIKPEQNAQR